MLNWIALTMITLPLKVALGWALRIWVKSRWDRRTLRRNPKPDYDAINRLEKAMGEPLTPRPSDYTSFVATRRTKFLKWWDTTPHFLPVIGVFVWATLSVLTYAVPRADDGTWGMAFPLGLLVAGLSYFLAAEVHSSLRERHKGACYLHDGAHKTYRGWCLAEHPRARNYMTV